MTEIINNVNIHIDSKTLNKLLNHGAYEVISYYTGKQTYGVVRVDIHIEIFASEEGNPCAYLKDGNERYVYIAGYPDPYYDDSAYPENAIYLTQSEAEAACEERKKRMAKADKADAEIDKARKALNSAIKKKEKMQ